MNSRIKHKAFIASKSRLKQSIEKRKAIKEARKLKRKQ